MSIDTDPPKNINDCKACYGTGIQGWAIDGEYEVRPCDVCMKD